MTALKRYQRLESSGLWKAGADAQRREVMVSFGDATLVINDPAGRPLTHWSLASIETLNKGEMPALFSPAPDAAEVLEIDDAEMVDAIATVQRTIERARARPGRIRWMVRLGLPLAFAAAMIAYGPEILIRQTAAVVPPVKRAFFGAELLDRMQATLGPECKNLRGQAALNTLQQRLLGTGGRLAVLPQGLGLAVALPGGVIALDQALIEGVDDPHIVAGQVLAAHAIREASDPMEPLLRFIGTRETVHLLTTGTLTDEALDRYAQELLTKKRQFPSLDDLSDQFDRANVPPAPFFASQGVTLPASEPLSPSVMTDAQWVALQGICLD